MTSRGFPNQFFTGFTQVGVSANIAANYELQGEHIAYVIAEAHEARRDHRRAQPGGPGQLVSERSRDRDRQLGFRLPCTPGYYNNEGRGGGERQSGAFLGDLYSPGFYAFGDLLASGATRADLEGLVLGR